VSCTATVTKFADSDLNPTGQQTSTLVFYWTVPQSTDTISYTWTLKDVAGNLRDSVTATATFTVVGPTGVTMNTPSNPVTIAHHFDVSGKDLGPYLSFGDISNKANAKPGMSFNATIPKSPSGSYLFVQLIQQQTFDRQEQLQRDICTSTDSGGNVLDGTNPPVLDTQYPYGTASSSSTAVSTNDTPGIPLNLIAYWEVAGLTFNARMYLMWMPQARSACQTQACTIPIPIGYVDWSWTGDTVNQKQLDTDGTIDDSWIPPAPPVSTGGPKNAANPFTQAGSINDIPQWQNWVGSGDVKNAKQQPQCTHPQP
jgi:hypothetical protein